MKNQLTKIAMAGAAFMSAVGLSACSNLEPADQVAAQLNPDGDVEIYDVQSKQVLFTTNETLIAESDRKDFIAEQKAQGITPVTLTGNEGDTVWRGVVVNNRGYTSELYCDTEAHQCDVGGSSGKSYRFNDEQVDTKPFTAKNFEPF